MPRGVLRCETLGSASVSRGRRVSGARRDAEKREGGGGDEEMICLRSISMGAEKRGAFPIICMG